MGNTPGNRRDDGGCGCARANHHHPFAAIVEICRPLLRVDDRPFESFLAGKVGTIAGRVVVVALAQQEKITGKVAGLTITAGGFERPLRCRRRPAGVIDALTKADMRFEFMLSDHFVQIAENFGGGRDRLALPRFKIIAIGIEITIRTNPRIAEEIPGAADGSPRLDDEIALLRAFTLQVTGGTKTRNPGPDDDDVAVFNGWVAVHLCLSLSVLVVNRAHETTIGFRSAVLSCPRQRANKRRDVYR